VLGISSGHYLEWEFRNAANRCAGQPHPAPWVLPQPGDWGGQFGAGPGEPTDGQNFINFRGLAFQDLSTTPGQQYRVSFWTSDLSTDGIHQWPSQLSVLWNDAPVATQQVDWPEWRRLDYGVSAAGPVTRLGLQVELGLDHQLRFDAVSVAVVVPEPGAGTLMGVGCVALWFARFRGSGRSNRAGAGTGSRCS
jgi:hypothetical protein